jgi:DNA-binding transcriptional LysR family regulator
MLFTVTELKLLAGLADGETLSGIAKRLAVGQPALSQSLKLLEARTGLLLVHHRRRGLLLTPTGELVARSASAIVTQLTQFEQMLNQLQNGYAGPLRIISSPITGNYVLPEILGKFLRNMPQVDVDIRVESARQIWNTFATGDYDLGVGPFWAGHALPDSNIWSVERLYTDQLVFFVAPDSPLASKPRVSWDDICHCKIINLFGETFWSRAWDHLSDQYIPAGQRIEVHGVEGLKRLVKAGVGIGALLKAAVRNEFQDRSLVPLAIEGVSISVPVNVVRRPGQAGLPVVDAFYTHLLEEASALFQPDQEQITSSSASP